LSYVSARGGYTLHWVTAVALRRRRQRSSCKPSTAEQLHLCVFLWA
jgi:hypothetical protein